MSKLGADVLANLILDGLWETLYMVLISTVISYVIGIPLGIIVFITDKNGICRNRPIHWSH